MIHVTALLAALAASAAAPDPRVAFRLAMRGDLDEASLEARRVLAASPRDRVALLVDGCVAVERDELDRAAAIARELEAAGALRGAVLARLAERRRSNGDEPLAASLVEAWKAAGSPDLSEDLPKGIVRWGPDEPLLSPLPAGAVAQLADAERLALTGSLESGLSLPPDFARDRERAVAAALEPRGNALWVDLLLLGRVRPSEADPDGVRARGAEAVRRLARAAATLDPGNGYYDMIRVVADASSAAPLTAPELDALEAGLAAPSFGWPRELLFQQLATRLVAVDPTHGRLRARWIAQGAVPREWFVLRLRAKATVDGAAQARAARVLGSVARRLGDSTSLFDRVVSVALEIDAAELSGDAARITAAKARDGAIAEWRLRLVAALDRLGEWPLVSTLEEPTPGAEIPFLERLAR